jgi:hypothetical protein
LFLIEAENKTVSYRIIILASPRTHLQTHSGEISMGAASGNRAGKPPEITLPVAAKLCNFHPSEIMDLEPSFIRADEKRSRL